MMGFETAWSDELNSFELSVLRLKNPIMYLSMANIFRGFCSILRAWTHSQQSNISVEGLALATLWSTSAQRARALLRVPVKAVCS